LSTEVLKALIQNSTLLVVAFLMLTRLSRWRLISQGTGSRILQGAAYALCGFLAMLFSVEVLPGVLIDMRTPIIVVAVLTGGPVVGLIALVPLLAYRLFVGGTGMTAGLGIILSAYAFGLVMRRFQRKPEGYLFQLAVGVGSAVIYYIWILTLPGEIVLTVLRETLIPLTAGSILSILVIFLIRKREAVYGEVMANLREMGDLFEEISLDENIGIVVLRKTRIEYVNLPLLEKFGYVSFDPGNSELLDIIAPEQHEKVVSYLDRVSSGKRPEALPMRLTVPGRGSLTFLIHARKLLYRGEESVLVVSVDITRLVETEKALQKRVDQLKLSLEASDAVLWRADIPSDRLIADDDFFSMLRYRPEEKPPLFSHFMVGTDMSPELRAAFRQMMESGSGGVFGEIHFTGEDGADRWFNIGARVTGSHPGEVNGILYETTPIKERDLFLREKEIEDLQSQKMETVGRLAGGVAHDFNNLLHVIMGYTEILRKVSGDDPVTGDLTGPIMEASSKGRELIRQLLLFSRHRSPLLKPVDLALVTRSFTGMLKRIMEENILISADIPDDLPPVLGDAGQMEQVLMNLCLNARDAMPGGGSIRISLRREAVPLQRKTLTGTLESGNYVVLTVADTGPGIPPERQKLVFEPFYTTKQVDRGTGLGLATVQGIVESHGGSIDACNRDGGGFTITVFFPEDGSGGTGAVMEAPAGRERKEAPQGITVLVAEDDPRVRDLTVEGLGASGIKVLKASDGAEAVKVFMNNACSISVLVFDVVMPVLSGPDAYREITAAGYDVPVVFTTGYAGDRLSGLPGKHLVLHKPYITGDLVQAIADLAGGGN